MPSNSLPWDNLADQDGHVQKDFANGDLKRSEPFWRDHQQWLETCGYMLRPRYRPGWVPSWKGTNKSYLACEDGQTVHVRIAV